MSIEIYTKEDCGYCTAAKNLLKSKNIMFTEQVLGIHFTREQLLANYSQAKTFPVIVVDGYYIGGYNQLQEHVSRMETTQVLLNETLPEPTIETPAAEAEEVTVEVLYAPSKKTTTKY
jgi:glutaredoxin 3